jgi:hypothetical protein
VLAAVAAMFIRTRRVAIVTKEREEQGAAVA